MRRFVAVLALVPVFLLTQAAWGLTESEQAGMNTLVEKTVISLKGGEQALWELFSTQGSAAVIQLEEGFAAGTRSKLKSDAELAAKFRIPECAQVDGVSFQRLGDFVAGYISLSAEIMPPTPPKPPVPPVDLGDVWGAFFSPDTARFVAPAPPVEPAPPQPIKLQWSVNVSAIQDGPKRTWRYVSLAVLPGGAETDQATTGDIIETVRAWERAALQGDVTELGQALYDDPFVVGAYTPDGQAWFFTYPEYLTTMLSTAFSMGSANSSTMGKLDVRAGASVATVIGEWTADLPVFGDMTLGVAITLVKEDGRWYMAALTGGLLEE